MSDVHDTLEIWSNPSCSKCRTAKAELDQVTGQEHAARSSRRRAAEARALENEEDD